MIALKTNDQLDPALLLGHLEFHSIADLRIHKKDLAKLFSKHGLSSKFLPDEIKAHDAFRRATITAQANNIQINHPSSSYARLLVREVARDDKRIVRHLVREVVDSRNEMLEYATVGSFEFYRTSEDVVISWDSNYLSEYNYKKILEDTRDLYEEWTKYHTRDTIRNIVTKVVDSMHPISIMPRGKASFIPKVEYDTLKALKDVIFELNNYTVHGESCRMEIIPILDTIDQRDMVGRRLESEVQSSIEALVVEFSELLQAKTSLRLSTVQRYASQITELQEKAEKYEQLLNQKMTVLTEQLTQALERVEAAPIDGDDD